MNEQQQQIAYADRPDVGVSAPVTFEVYGLTEAQAFALAELCKRIGFSDARGLAVDEAEAYAMLYAVSRVRVALEAVGVTVR